MTFNYDSPSPKSCMINEFSASRVPLGFVLDDQRRQELLGPSTASRWELIAGVNREINGQKINGKKTNKWLQDRWQSEKKSRVKGWSRNGRW